MRVPLLSWLLCTTTPQLGCRQPLFARHGALTMKTKAESDAESNQRLVDALFGQSDGPVVEKDKDTPSHMQLDLNEDGEPLQMRFVYVDETSCIGCTYCADVARSTFYMNDDAGRARVYSQGGDEPEIVQEAIECCPVNCDCAALRMPETT